MNASLTETPPDLPREVPLRRNKGFRMLWIGQLLSDTGSDVGLLAYPLLILALTHSAVLAGIVAAAREVALICLQLPAGALSDRLDRRLTMIACDVMRAVLLVTLGVLIALHLASWPVVLVVSVIEGSASAIFNPAATAALPGIVPDGQLEEAWAATEARTWGASLAGTAIGGVLFGLGRAVPFLADAVSYGASFGTVSRIRGRFRPEQTAERKALWREAADGLRLVWQVPILRVTVITAPLVNFSFNGVLFTIILAMRQHGTSSAVIGLVQAAIMAGGLVGGLVAPRLQGRMSVRTITIVMFVAETVLFGVAALLIPSPVVAVPVAIVPLLAPAGNAALFAVMLRKAPEEMRGRVTNTVSMVAMALAALAPLVAGLLVQHTSGGWAIGAFAATMAVATVLCLTLRGLRDVDSPAESRAAVPGLKRSFRTPNVRDRAYRTGMAIARYPSFVIDSADPHALATFYGALLDWKVELSENWADIRGGEEQCISFQRVDGYTPPNWPTQALPQQMHLDVMVEDLDAGEAAVLELGATKHEHQPGTTFRVFLDPAGHPFCLCVD